MSRYRRWNELLELLGSRGQLQVEDAAKALNVSAATIRRDFDELASQQMLTRIRGGAVAEGVNYDLPLRYKTERHPSEKQRIGALAASMVRAGQVAGLNGGTTTTEVARALATRSDLGTAGPSPTVTVVTNALNIATELAIRQHIKIVTTGGVARPQSYELTGPLATSVLEQVMLDAAILEQEPRAGVHVPRATQQRPRHVRRGQRGHRAQRGQDGPVPATGQRHRHPGGRVLADRDEADVDPLGGQLVPHELTRRIGADRGDQRDPKPQPRRGHRGDRGRTPDDQRDPVHQLLLLAEYGVDVRTEDEHVRVAVTQDHQVKP